jgi:hypothetical protein
VLDVDLKSESQSLCVDIYNKYCTYRYICRSINITILQNLLYLNCLYVNMDDGLEYVLGTCTIRVTLAKPVLRNMDNLDFTTSFMIF